MLKMTRLAVSAAVLVFAAASAVLPQMAGAQAQPAAPAAPAAAPAATAPAPAAAAPAAQPAAGTRSTEIVDNPYGLEALWKGGDIVAKVTLAILAIMSMGSWYIIITKVYEQFRMGAQARAADKSFWNAPHGLLKIAANSYKPQNALAPQDSGAKLSSESGRIVHKSVKKSPSKLRGTSTLKPANPR